MSHSVRRPALIGLALCVCIAREGYACDPVYGPDCQPVAWGSAPAWSPPREPAFYTGQVRPREKWLDGLPTVDIYMAWREPVWRSADPRWPHPISDAGLLNSAEFLELYSALPTATALARSPTTVLRDLDRWAARIPAIVNREPAATIQANLRRAASTKGSP